MDEPFITAQEISERTVPDPANVAAMVAMAMRVRSGRKPGRLHAIPIDAGVSSGQPVVGSASRVSP